MSAKNGNADVPQRDEEDGYFPKVDWKATVSKGTSLHDVHLETGRNGWAAPPVNLFALRGVNFFSKRTKTPSDSEPLLKPLGVDWLKSSSKLEHVLAHPSNVVNRAFRSAKMQGDGLKAFVLAINLMVPGKDHHSAVLYFATEEPIIPGSLLYRFINGDDAFRNTRFKLINKIVRGPWIVKAAAGNHSACLLGKALNCQYIRGPSNLETNVPSYLEIDVDIGSSTVANAILHLALGYVTLVAVDMAFVIEGQSEQELPERVLGAVRVSHMDTGAATMVEPVPDASGARSPEPSSLQSQMSWKKLGRSLSLLAGVGKPGRVDVEGDRKVAC